jgi:hypothetical protein
LADGVGVDIAGGVGSALGSRVGGKEPSLERGAGFSSKGLPAEGKEGVADWAGAGRAGVTAG